MLRGERASFIESKHLKKNILQLIDNDSVFIIIAVEIITI